MPNRHRHRRPGSRRPRGHRRHPPALQSDGGDIVFNGIDADSAVHVTLVGACGTCPVSMMTLKAGVERIIMDWSQITEVISE